MIVVATVPHSGTMQLLKMLGHPPRPMRALEEKHLGGAQILFTHLEDGAMPRLVAEHAAGVPILTTRRALYDIRASWVRRGEDLKQLEIHLANYSALLAMKPYVMELGACR